MSTEDQFETDIERYLNGRMSDEEQATFENTLAEDKALFDRFESYKAIQYAIDIYHEEELKAELKARGSKKMTSQTLRRAVATLLFILAVLMVGYYVCILRPSTEQEMKQASPQDSIPDIERTQEGSTRIYAQFFTPVDLAEFQLLSNDQGGTQALVHAYESGDCTTVIATANNLTNIAQDKEALNLTHLLAASCHIQNNNSRELILDQLQQIDPSAVAYHRLSQWYMAIVYAQYGQYAVADSILSNHIIANEYHPKRTSAIQLREAIK